MTNKTDDIGTRMKRYEQRTLSVTHFLPGDCLIARLDGNAFHTFTKGLARPYEERLSMAMVDTMKQMVHLFGADVGFIQSDEITLVWKPRKEEFMFGGRQSKLIGIMAARCSVEFGRIFERLYPDWIVSDTNIYGRDLPIFDCRFSMMPTVDEAVNNLIWRQQDCVKNAISMAAQSMFKHGELQNKNGSEMQEMMFSVHGVNFNDYPAFFKRGTFGRRMETIRPLTQEELDRMPEAIRSVRAQVPLIRRKVESFDCWITASGDTMNERADALFGTKPVKE